MISWGGSPQGLGAGSGRIRPVSEWCRDPGPIGRNDGEAVVRNLVSGPANKGRSPHLVYPGLTQHEKFYLFWNELDSDTDGVVS